MNKEKILNIFREEGFRDARLLGGSKSLYCKAHPDDDILFNANIVIRWKKVVWHGDLNITLDAPALQRVADKTGETLYILQESLASWGNERMPFRFHKKHAHAKFVPGVGGFVREYGGLHGVTGAEDTWTVITQKPVGWKEM